MEFLEDIDTLAGLYGQVSSPAKRKVARRLTPLYREWIMASRFCVLCTVGPEGTDGSPRGDDGPCVTELDPGTLAMPDWRGNNRLDSLRNIIRDPRVSLMFMVPGSNEVVRVNGTAKVTADTRLCGRFQKKGKLPTTVIVIEIDEIYVQCSRAVLRARLWAGEDEKDRVPTLGQILSEMTSGAEGGAEFDRHWTTRSVEKLW